MRGNRLVRLKVLAGLLALVPPRPAVAGLHIQPIVCNVGEKCEDLTCGAPPAGSLIAGGGNLQEIFQVAAEQWERVFRHGGGQWNVTIKFGWTLLRPGSGLFGQALTEDEGGNPRRITRSCVFFNNEPPNTVVLPNDGWFADPTPRDHSEYLRYTFSRVDLEQGQLNVGRVFSEATGDAVDRIDLLTTAMHEIGHTLGLDGDYSGFRAQLQSNLFVDITPPRPFKGLSVTITAGPHIGGFGSTPLMTGLGESPNPGLRQLISAVDALLVSQLSSFPRANLDEPPFR